MQNVLHELRRNKLRSFLSLFGITIGVFCIISVLATVNSLERNIRSEMKALGSNTIYIDKWEYSASGPDYPYWKYVRRPEPKYSEVEHIRTKTSSAQHVAFKISTLSAIQHRGYAMKHVRIYGFSEDFHKIQPVQLQYGHYFTAANFFSGAPVAVIGSEIAGVLFGHPQNAIGKFIVLRGKKIRLIGVVKKQGRQLLGGWEFDISLVLNYRFARTLMNEQKSDPVILVQAKENVDVNTLKGELTGTMRMLHTLRAGQPNDFSLNDINDFGAVLEKTFRNINLAGWSIGALSFIVGIFGVANIMFVSVKERTSQIGLKKAVGARQHEIRMEFLTESAILCVIGGCAGVLLVYIFTLAVTLAADFPVTISAPVLVTALLISVLAGLLAGLWPAHQAARLNPIDAIRY